MSKPNPYAFLTPLAATWMRDQMAAEKAAQRPSLTVVASSERTIPMETMDKQPAAPIASAPLCHHEAYQEMEKAIRELTLGIDALKGIGVMMQPESQHGNEQLTSTRRGDISAIFEFFGEALRQRVDSANDAAQSLEFVAAIKNG